MKIAPRQPSLTRSVLGLGAAALFLQLGCNPPKGDGSRSGESTAKVEQANPTPLTNMVLIKAGTFQRIRFPVTITHDFWIGKYEVTQGEYEKAVGKNPSHFQGDPARPVEKVTFHDAMAYCRQVSRQESEAGRLPAGWQYRLPTEAEWEFACRAGTTNLFSFGNATTNADQFAWTLENAEGTTHPVGQKQPNPWGLYDMHGNVWEWCLDWFEPYPATNLVDPVGPPQSKFKVFRGGGWNNDINMARSANRFMMVPTNGIHFVGFRIALARK